LPIATEDLAPAQGLAVCRFCEKPFPLAASQAAVPYERRPSVPELAPPKGVSLVETMDGFHLSISTRSWAAVFLVPFTLVWSGGSLGGIYGTQIAKGEFSLTQSLFGLPFLIGSVFLIGLTVMAVAGRLIVELAGGRLRLRAGALGVYRTKSADWRDVRGCRLTEVSLRGRYSNSFQVEVAVEGGKPLRVGIGAERETMLWVSRFLAGRIRRGR
jgi:hypothetical protein